MMIRGLLRDEEGGRLETARSFLRVLLEAKIVDALFVSLDGSGHSMMPGLIKDSAVLARANPFAPVMAFNNARFVSALTREDSGAKLGAVLRPCEARAVVELAKFNQTHLDKLVIIGMDCTGTFGVPEYLQLLHTWPDLPALLLTGNHNGQAHPLPYRAACRICEHPTTPNADINFGFIGVDDDHALLIEAPEDIARLAKLTADDTISAAREEALAKTLALRISARDVELDKFRALTRGGGLSKYLADCVECTNCMNACPICYCKECFFRTSNAERSPRELLKLAGWHGALTMPPDAQLFHLTRLNHMATSCVGCGMCEAACPHDLPLTTMFRAVAMRVQNRFNYVPGVHVEDKPPFMSYRPDELPEIGRAGY